MFLVPMWRFYLKQTFIIVYFQQKPQPEKKVETTVSNAVVVLEKNKVNDYNQVCIAC